MVFNTEVIRKDIAKHSSDAEDEIEIQHSLMHTLTHMSRERGALAHEDILDVLAICVQQHVDHLDIDAEEVTIGMPVTRHPYRDLCVVDTFGDSLRKRFG